MLNLDTVDARFLCVVVLANSSPYMGCNCGQVCVSILSWNGCLMLRLFEGDMGTRVTDKWLVELLFDDLLLWTDWIRDHRVGTNKLVFLGSDNVPAGYSDRHQCSTTAAKWESG